MSETPGRERCLTHEQARAIYDRIGARQDAAAWHEDRPIEAMLRQGAFEEARSVLEFGCGTGRFAEGLLRDRLPSGAEYVGIDQSPVMVRLARERLRPWADRAQVIESDGSVRLPDRPGGFDRVVSNFVMDLLSREDIDDFLEEAGLVLSGSGRLCLVCLTVGERGIARLFSRLWRAVHGLDPRLVGGCRPLRLAERLPPDAWRILRRSVVTTWGVASEVVVTSRLATPAPGA